MPPHTAAGIPTLNLVGAGRVAQTLALKRAKRFSKVHVWRILGQLGFSCQKPEGRARERNEPAIQTWKQAQWPALKKKP